MGGSKRSGDLLGLERITPLEKRLRVCNEGENPTEQSSDRLSVLSRVKEFLPLIDTANRKLSSDDQEKGSAKLDIEHLTNGEEAPHIRMDLALGVTELYTPEAILAAQQAVGGRVQDQPELLSDSSDSAEQDTGEEESEEEEGPEEVEEQEEEEEDEEEEEEEEEEGKRDDEGEDEEENQ
ncbi:RNA-directed DNA methylation 4 [Selaginella moellendorffii]|uniref:RNA-directed DNA methylation 4 n=1 Tax=Selaginella moellendorffii TaxID=88036 RepID=UPI000D1C765E|nr:RNA-directed DNA methylation 4 [Selaginella moellendorffii]|eukprot:XP_024520568.1 RNA-directed DNA methylation 4 [Selaginella moellendorffii]